MTTDIKISRELLQNAYSAVAYLALRAEDIGHSNVPIADELRALLANHTEEPLGVVATPAVKRQVCYQHNGEPCQCITSPPAPVAVELAELLRRVVATGALTFDSQPDFESLEADICACLDKVKEMNR